MLAAPGKPVAAIKLGWINEEATRVFGTKWDRETKKHIMDSGSSMAVVQRSQSLSCMDLPGGIHAPRSPPTETTSAADRHDAGEEEPVMEQVLRGNRRCCMRLKCLWMTAARSLNPSRLFPSNR